MLETFPGGGGWLDKVKIRLSSAGAGTWAKHDNTTYYVQEGVIDCTQNLHYALGHHPAINYIRVNMIFQYKKIRNTP